MTADVHVLLQRYWGYEAFLPQQRDAIEAILAGRDTVVILPTGGGKSVTFQLPALAGPGCAVVCSPLVALMKDQVDALRDMGIEAGSLNSAMTPDERRDVVARLRNGTLKLLYVAPERLALSDTRGLLEAANVRFFAIDEAHCVSQWGHEFRPEYRQLRVLREWFPAVPILACTATATPAVRDDIEAALGLRDPVRIVGSFDRPNLVYRTVYRRGVVEQVRAVLDRHPGEAGVVYCIRRSDVDDLCATLVKQGVRAVPYHAGLSAEIRRQNQDAFATERADVVVATVAFGMGIDRSDVRFVVHTGMPKSLEAYQQEAGRAGRDRLEAECVLLYDASDPVTWRRIQGEPGNEYERSALDKLNSMYRYCRTLACRHRTLVEYFGEKWSGGDNCGACDVCLGEHALVDDGLTIARKILSCVVRVEERFGAGYVAEVLKGAKTAKITNNGHNTLSTYGLLSMHHVDEIRDWIDQLQGLGHLERRGEYGVLGLTLTGRRVMAAALDVQLAVPRPSAKKGAKPVLVVAPAEEQVFQGLRAARRTLALEKGVPPYMIFSDATLRDLAARRPSDLAGLLAVKGIGATKAEQYGAFVLDVLGRSCQDAGLTQDAAVAAAAPVERARPNAEKSTGEAAFARGASVADVVAATGRAPVTVEGWLADWVARTGATDVSAWVDEATILRVAGAASEHGSERLKPIFEALGDVPYVQIRVALAALGNR